MNKQIYKNRIDEVIYNQITDNLYEKDSIPKLTFNRFDLAFKLMYLETFNNSDHASDCEEIYTDHIRAFSLGSFKEPGNDSKNSLKEYIDVFKSLYDDIKNNGFDGSRSVVPLAKDGSILNGAHRSTIAINLNKEIKCLQTNLEPSMYSYNFFYERKVPESVLDKVATKFVEFSSDTYIAFIWPTAKNYEMDVKSLFPNVVYSKSIQLNSNGAHNLLSRIYEDEKWLGTIENNFKGVVNKLVKCFSTYDPIRVVAFQANSLKEVLKIKENIRNTFNVGKHSIHITDTHEEAIRTARTVFNGNSIHFLNYAKPNNYISLHNQIKLFKQYLEDNSIKSRTCILDSSITLSAYGLREASDIDYLSSTLNEIRKHNTKIESHDDELKHHKFNKNELIFNSDNYFYFRGLKFISFHRLYHFKKCRFQNKDKNDIELMEALIERKRLKKLRASIRQKMLYRKIYFKESIIKILKVMNVYNTLRSIYRISKK